MRLFIFPVAFFAVTIPCSSQRVAPKPEFEVASIRPNSTARPRVAEEPGGRFVATGVPLQVLIGYAYRGQSLQLSGAPDWVTSDLWDIEAKAPAGTVAPRIGPPDLNTATTMNFMVQSLLEDRFQLKMHREVRELSVYELTVAKGGLKIKLSDNQSPPAVPTAGAPGTAPRGGMLMTRGLVEASAVSFSNLVPVLAQVLQRRVVDKTGLKGYYDFKLQWTPDTFSSGGVGPATLALPPQEPLPTDPAGVSALTAIEEQLGLKVTAAKAPLEVTVLDSVRKPSPN